ncbi:hypothetical protein ACFVIX_06170 [Bacillus subtilis]|jgi:hypothetical protein|uniref:Uncharacterized protein n=1 Tax=Bacillus subtilis TaxID=1423 RepID=A0A0D1K8S8_BACIU|nr:MULTISPECIES: hypothetical protein [Bacillus subtilis group]AVB12169.1 hypothetical protein C3438_22190 [Bacillus velezensis]AYK76514.1 hypothetical protein D9C12_22455 [Bacillus subtilis subsp. subtilis]AYL03143.1 hypothetical protein D9C08_22605 [Bacillus subtilis subsp. subtilis]KIU04535.1 hypothetical protein SC09_contig8orf00201 [Bacillus subtilis]MCB4339405.1 hypothetical protein [Bacillus subtilis]
MFNSILIILITILIVGGFLIFVALKLFAGALSGIFGIFGGRNRDENRPSQNDNNSSPKILRRGIGLFLGILLAVFLYKSFIDSDSGMSLLNIRLQDRIQNSYKESLQLHQEGANYRFSRYGTEGVFANMKYDTEFQREHLGAEGYILKVDYEDANESDKEKLFELLKEDRKLFPEWVENDLKKNLAGSNIKENEELYSDKNGFEFYKYDKKGN